MGLNAPSISFILGLAAARWCSGAESFSFFEPVQPPRMFQVVAHRGEAGQAPENTRPALQRCIDDGLEWAEVDVRLTQDGRHILWHDASVTDASGKSWKISESSWAELQQLDVGSRFAARFAKEPLLSLQGCFALCKNRLNLYLDCKAINPEQLAQEILAAGMERQVVVYSGLEDLRRVRAASSGKVATMAKWRPVFGLGDWAVTNGLAAVEIDAPDITPAVCENFRRAGIKVQAKVLGAWDQPEMWERVMAAGVNWLQTDVPEEVVAHALWRHLSKRPVQISLHRGANRYAPENTLPAFQKAIRMGVDFVEFDVRTTHDGAFFLLHDSRLDGKTDGTGPIDQLTADAVRKRSAGVKFGYPYAAVPLPTLDDFLSTVAGKVGLYFDAKAIAPTALAEALHRYNVTEQTVVYQSPEFLTKLKAIDPRIRALPPLHNAQDFDQLVAKLHPFAVDTSWEILSKELIDRCHQAGIRVFSDALGDHETIEEYSKAMDWGIDLIQTDYPLRVLRAIELRSEGKTAVPQPPESGANNFSVRTYTFKTLDSTAHLDADVHRPNDDLVRPVVVFIHGGALMMGGRKLAPKPGSLLEALLRAGFAVVSIDYRLAPEVRLPAILEDVRDACAWVRRRGPELFHINPEEMFVMGQSAGGYLTLMSGVQVQPPPRALVSFWGYGDIAGPWYSRPDPFYRQQPLVTKEEADKNGGAKLYLYCRQQGLWPQVLTGHDPESEPHAFDPFCPIRNVTPHYPPTVLIHGTEDTDVPYELSDQMAGELAAKRVEHDFITVPEGGHGFDNRNQDVAVRTYEQVIAFLEKHRGPALRKP